MPTETVTVLFTDLVDSTAMLTEVGGQHAEDLRQEHFALLRSATESTSGREVKNLGDGLMLVFSSAADSVAAAVAIQQAFERRNRRAERALVVRVGVSLGDADVEDGDYFGRPVVEAARLCATARGGEILVADVVRLLTGTRGGFEFEPVGDLDLKGFDDPVAGCRVAWPSVNVGDQHALPPRLASAVIAGFVGREAEAEQLASAWKDVDTGDGRRVLLLAGEPGMGKTTLAARFSADVRDGGGHVLYGRSDEVLGIPYQPWIELLGQLVRELPEAVLAEHVEDCGGSLARLVPDLAKRVPVEVPATGDADTDRFVLFGCVTDLLARAADGQPLLVVLDDLHWVDRPSVQLLRHVVMADRPMRVAVLGTFRDSEVGDGHPLADLLAGLHRESGVHRIPLRGLNDTDLLALLEQVAGHEMGDGGIALRDAVLTETAGNPFFIGEILRHLVDTGAVYRRDDGQWGSDVDLRAAGLPVSVKEVVGRRLAGLGPDTGRVLALAAVIGRDFDVASLAAVARLDEDAVVDLCDAAVSAAVLQTTNDPDRYTFAHALIEHTLYDGLSPARRARAHHGVAEELERRWGTNPGDHAGELARHWGAVVQPADLTKAVYYATVAGAQALSQLAPDEAMRWYSTALELVDQGPADRGQRAEILVGLGEAQLQCGDPVYRETLIEAAHLADEIGDVELLVRAALSNNRGFFSVIGGVDEERVAVIELALARQTDPDGASRARLLALSCAEQVWGLDLDAKMTLAHDAIATARRSGDPIALFDALRNSGVGVAGPQNLDLRRTWSAEACAIATALGDPVREYRAHYGIWSDAVEAGDADTARGHWVILEDLSRRLPHAGVQWMTAFGRVIPSLLAGDLDEAERHADAALTLGIETGQPDPMGIYAGNIASIRRHQGRSSELIELIEQVVAESPRQPVYRAALANASSLGGLHDRAATLLADEHTADFSMALDNTWITGLCTWSEVAVSVGDHAAAHVLRERLAPFHSQMAYTGVTIEPSVAHYLGQLDRLLGRYDDADRWFREAMVIHEGFRSPLFVAYTQSAWASLLADRRDDTGARRLADASLAAAVNGGFGYIEADARAVLTRLP